MVFYRCKVCDLVFKDPKIWPSKQEEYQRYLQHKNSLDDVRCRDFFMRLVTPLIKCLKKGMKGLDYGSGPAPLLATLIKEFEFDCESYDPYFLDDKDLLLKKYDFITCCEVVEHFHDPANEIKKLRKLLNKGGVLAIMTNMVPQDFATWWYHKDPTHVVFYSVNTFKWIVDNCGFYFALETSADSEDIACKLLALDLSKDASIVLLIAS